ncbi:unnamed protein product [Boreogadus saida]
MNNNKPEKETEPSEFANHEEEVRTLFVSGLPLDIKPRELYLLFRPFKGYEGSLIKLTSKQSSRRPSVTFGSHRTELDWAAAVSRACLVFGDSPMHPAHPVGFVSFDSRSEAEAAKNALNDDVASCDAESPPKQPQFLTPARIAEKREPQEASFLMIKV